MNNPLEYLSFSRLNSYDMCGEKFRLSYIEGVPQTPLGAALGGSAVHVVIEDAEREEWWKQDIETAVELMTVAFQTVFETKVEEAGGPDEIRWGGRKDKEGNRTETYQWWYEHAGPLFLRRYRTIREQDDKLGWKLLPDGVEMEVGATLDLEGFDEGIYVKGFIDAVGMITEDGEVVLRDWKTGTFNQPFQLAVYAWLLKQGRGLTCDLGQIGYLRGSTKDSWLKEYPLAEWVPLVPRRFTDLVAGIQMDIFPIKPSNLCSSCMVRLSCDYGRTLPEE